MNLWDLLKSIFSSFFSKSKAPKDYYQGLYENEKARADSLHSSFTICQTEKSALITERNEFLQARYKIANERDKIAEENIVLKREKEELKESLDEATDKLELRNQHVKEYEKSIAMLQNAIRAKDNEIKNMKAIVLDDSEVKMTPEYLVEMLKNKTWINKAQTWNEYDSALVKIFALQPVVPLQVSAKEYKERIENTLKDIAFHSSPKDARYFLCTIAEAKRRIQNDWGDLRPYVPEKQDCDKFAQRLRVHFYDVYHLNNVIELWGYWKEVYHSWTAVVCSDGILEVEPQTDEMMGVPPGLKEHIEEVVHDY